MLREFKNGKLGGKVTDKKKSLAMAMSCDKGKKNKKSSVKSRMAKALA